MSNELTVRGFQLIYGKLNLARVGVDTEVIAATRLQGDDYDKAVSVGYRFSSPGGSGLIDAREYGDGMLITQARDKSDHLRVIVARMVGQVDNIGRPYFASRVVVIPRNQVEALDYNLAWLLIKDKVSRPEDYTQKSALGIYTQTFAPDEISQMEQRKILELVLQQPSDVHVYFRVLKLLYRPSARPICFLNYDPTQAGYIALALSFGLPPARRLRLSFLTSFVVGARADVRVIFAKAPDFTVPPDAYVVNWKNGLTPNFDDEPQTAEFEFIQDQIERLAEAYSADKLVQRILDFPRHLQAQLDKREEDLIEQGDIPEDIPDILDSNSPDTAVFPRIDDNVQAKLNVREVETPTERVVPTSPSPPDYYKVEDKKPDLPAPIPSRINGEEWKPNDPKRSLAFFPLKLPDPSGIARKNAADPFSPASSEVQHETFFEWQSWLNDPKNQVAYRGLSARHWVQQIQWSPPRSEKEQNAFLYIWDHYRLAAQDRQEDISTDSSFWNTRNTTEDDAWVLVIRELATELAKSDPEFCLKLLKHELARDVITERITVFAHAFTLASDKTIRREALEAVCDRFRVAGHVLYPLLLYLFIIQQEDIDREPYVTVNDSIVEGRIHGESIAERVARTVMYSISAASKPEEIRNAIYLLLAWFYMLAYNQRGRSQPTLSPLVQSSIHLYWHPTSGNAAAFIDQLKRANLSNEGYRDFREALKRRLYRIDLFATDAEYDPLSGINTEVEHIVENAIKEFQSLQEPSH